MRVLDTTCLEQLGVELVTFLHYLGVPRIASISHHLVRQEVRDVLVGGAGRILRLQDAGHSATLVWSHDLFRT